MNSSTIISFDLDDTLFDNRPVIIGAFDALYNYLSTEYTGFESVFTPRSFIEYAHETRTQHPDIVDFNVLRHIHIHKALEKAGFPEQNTELAYQVFLNARQQVSLYPESLEVLKQLAEKFTLISISNGNAEPERIGLGGLFSASFNPTSFGYAKPDPMIYNRVCKELKLQPQQLLHIGDCLENDYHAALQAGCRAIWYNLKSLVAPEHTQISQLSELPSLIESLEMQR